MIKTVLKEYPKVTVEEDFNPKRIRDYLTRHYHTHKQGVDMVNLALDKLDFIISQRGSEIVTVELLKALIKQAIDLADSQDDNEEIHINEQMLADGRISISDYVANARSLSTRDLCAALGMTYGGSYHIDEDTKTVTMISPGEITVEYRGQSVPTYEEAIARQLTRLRTDALEQSKAMRNKYCPGWDKEENN